MEREFIPIREAAKAVHKSRAFVRQLVDAEEVPAIVAGGSPKAPWLTVRIADVQAAIMRTQAYQPKTAKHHRRWHPRMKNGLHPAAAAM